MTELLLHIGHGKTGSSYIQRVLAGNVSFLRSVGFLYPMSRRDKRLIPEDSFSGNGELILKKRLKIGPATILSDEGLCQRLALNDNLEKYVLSRGLDLTIFLWSRNPFDFFASSYLQYLSTGLGNQNFDEYILLNRNPYSFVLWWLKKSKEHGFKIVFRNYSNHKSELISVFLKDLLGEDIDPSKIKLPLMSVVNRSLSPPEAMLISCLYSSIGEDVRYLANQLISRCPDVKSFRPKISQNSYDYAFNKTSVLVDEINEMVSDDERLYIEEFKQYNDDAVDFDNQKTCTLSREQCLCLSQMLAEMMSSQFIIDRRVKKLPSVIRKLIERRYG